MLLKWKTEQEINNAYFEIQRSADGINWQKVTVVFPHPSHNYESVDNAVAAGIYYYRIKQVDIDGNYKYSIIKAIRTSGDNKIFIWPNPVNDNLYVQTPFATGSMEITDISGRIVRKEIITAKVTTIPVQQLTRGIYVIIVRHDGNMFTEKFVKQ